MKIIKDKRWKTKYTCFKCKSVLELEENDFLPVGIVATYDGDFATVYDSTCICGRRITYSSSEIPDDIKISICAKYNKENGKRIRINDGHPYLTKEEIKEQEEKKNFTNKITQEILTQLKQESVSKFIDDLKKLEELNRKKNK